MPRPATATPAAVLAAIQALRMAGQAPTGVRIRALIGGGSLTTIARLRREIMAATYPDEMEEVSDDEIRQRYSQVLREITSAMGESGTMVEALRIAGFYARGQLIEVAIQAQERLDDLKQRQLADAIILKQIELKQQQSPQTTSS